jgi:hypothetical protein
MTDHQIKLQIEEHVKVHERVTKESEYWLEKNKKQVAENSSLAAFSRGIYYCFVLYRLDLETFIAHEINNYQPDEIFIIYKGRKSVRIFLDIINMFEAQLSSIINENDLLKSKLDEKIKPQLESIEKNWSNPEVKVKDGLLKKDILSSVNAKKLESSFRRRAIYNLGWINKQEFDLLEFGWFFRNCMHNDFSALSDKKFEFTDDETGEVLKFEFKKGGIIFSHTRFIYGLSRAIARVLDKIIDTAYKNQDVQIKKKSSLKQTFFDVISWFKSLWN